MITAGSWFVILWGINYYFSGMPDYQTVFVFWPYLNFEKIREWGTLLEVLVFHWGRSGLVANQLPFGKEIFYLVLTCLRLDVWLPLFFLSTVLISLSLIWRKASVLTFYKQHRHIIFAFGGFLMLAAVLTSFLGREQPISFYRFTSFTYAPMLCFCLILLAAFLRNKITGSIFIVVLCATYFWIFNKNSNNFNAVVSDKIQLIIGDYDIQKVKGILNDSKKYISGRYSIADAYKNQQKWPGRMPWGGIYPPAEAAWKQVSSSKPIWTMHIHSYCMLPGCYMESYLSFRISPHIDTVLYGKPEDAISWLKKENHDYFFISTSLQLTDPLPLSPLFSPANIAKYMGVVWTDGDNALLTWKENARFPIDKNWLRHYSDQVKDSSFIKSFPYDSVRFALNKIKRDSKIQESELPWYRAGWK